MRTDWRRRRGMRMQSSPCPSQSFSVLSAFLWVAQSAAPLDNYGCRTRIKWNPPEDPEAARGMQSDWAFFQECL